jgi:phage-related protein
MLGFNLSDAASLVSRMEAVARSMAESAAKMEAVTEGLTNSVLYDDRKVIVTVNLDGKEVAKVIQDYTQKESARK